MVSLPTTTTVLHCPCWIYSLSADDDVDVDGHDDDNGGDDDADEYGDSLHHCYMCHCRCCYHQMQHGQNDHHFLVIMTGTHKCQQHDFTTIANCVVLGLVAKVFFIPCL